MKLKSVIFSCASLAMAVAMQSANAETWRMATKMPADSSEGKVFSYFAEKVNEETDGELNVIVFPNEQLGKEDAVLEQLQSGIVHIYAEGFPFLRKWTPELEWVEPPFIFDSFDHWARFMNSDLVQGWFADAAEKSGIIPLGNPAAIVRGPYRVMVSNKPIESVDDIQGLKLRMHNATLSINVWKELGANVITLPWTDVYSSMSKNIVNAVNSPVALVEAMRFNEVAPHIIEHDEMWQAVGFMMNQKAYQDLDDDVREGLLRAYDAAGVYSKELMYKAAEESVARMVSKGATFSQIDAANFVEKVQPYYESLDERGELPEGFLKVVNESR